MDKSIFIQKKVQPICVGTGLVALDVVFNDNERTTPRLWAGGSCGNVLTILSYLGWKSIPIIRIGEDEPAKLILKDLATFGVCHDFVDLDKAISTPIIIEKISSGLNGIPTHRFQWLCPNCGSWLPRYRSLLLNKAKQAINLIPKVNCFYFDRVSPGALALATKARELGGFVFFEPPTLKNDEMFGKAIKLSDVIKLANGRICEGLDLDAIEGPRLIVQTLGNDGIRFRFTNNNWKRLAPFPVMEFRDAAGAGDWCSAGIIFSLAQRTNVELSNFSENRIVKALELGQAMAALNCSYEGARGGMYTMNIGEFECLIKEIIKRKIVVDPMKEALPQHLSEMFTCLCPECQKKVPSKSKMDRD
jgi:fructokinase